MISQGGKKHISFKFVKKIIIFIFIFLNPFSKVVTSVQTFLWFFLAEGVDCAVSSADMLKEKNILLIAESFELKLCFCFFSVSSN